MRCPECDAEAAAEAKFCSKCGADLQHMTCPSCGTALAAGTRFCAQCGHAVENTATGAAGSVGARSTGLGPAASGSPVPPAVGAGHGEWPAVPHASMLSSSGTPPSAGQGVPAGAQRRGRGCIGWGCMLILYSLAIVVVVGGVFAALYFRVPARLGLVTPPEERLLSGTPDRAAAKALKD
ncbi:MAG: zinc ribbon domain-containing protein, partial [Armatimonadetes bacterium]|nr:zinc ribbon domain-containing protein [Armatimonadota bacterium]